MKNIIIFSSLLLPPSQTFIRAQVEKLEKFVPYYVGSRRVEGLSLPLERTLAINQGGLSGKTAEALFKLFGFAPKLYQQVQKLNPVLIHAQFGLSGALVLPWIRTLKLPLLVHFRGADATVKEKYSRYTSLNHWIYYRRLEQLKREARLFITVSKYIKEKLIEQGFPTDKIVTHYHGVDTASFCPDTSIMREPVILFVGRLTEKKGCKYLIEAIARIQAILPDLELVMIGDGPLRTDLEALAAKSLRRYCFLGTQPHPVVQSWMKRARLLAAPSVTTVEGDSEGLPNVVLEAQAMGLPVISTIHSGIPEAVIHGQTGFLAPERDVEKLAEYSLQLLQAPDLWQHFSVGGREHMLANFDQSKQVRVLEEIYGRVIN